MNFGAPPAARGGTGLSGWRGRSLWEGRGFRRGWVETRLGAGLRTAEPGMWAGLLAVGGATHLHPVPPIEQPPPPPLQIPSKYPKTQQKKSQKLNK